MIILQDVQLEIDTERGVIYVVSTETGLTLMRLSKLPTPVPEPGLGTMLDISCVNALTSWGKNY